MATITTSSLLDKMLRECDKNQAKFIDYILSDNYFLFKDVGDLPKNKRKNKGRK